MTTLNATLVPVRPIMVELMSDPIPNQVTLLIRYERLSICSGSPATPWKDSTNCFPSSEQSNSLKTLLYKRGVCLFRWRTKSGHNSLDVKRNVIGQTVDAELINPSHRGRAIDHSKTGQLRCCDFQLLFAKVSLGND